MDDTIFFFFHDLANRSEYLDHFVVFIARFFPYIVILLAIFFLLSHHDVLISKSPFKAFAQKWKEITLVFFSGILAWFVSYVLKIIFHTPRPFVLFENITPLLTPSDFSFPSGHSTFFMALAVAIFLSHRKVGSVFIFFAILIGIGRIVSGVHFPVDILGGFILGIFIPLLIQFLSKKP